MSKNVRRGRTGSVICGSCGQITRRDRAVYLFKGGIKLYYCPDCAKKIHNSRLFKGLPRTQISHGRTKTKRKFVIYAKEDSAVTGLSEEENIERAPVEPKQDGTEQT